MIDQEYQERLPEGMIRCYLVHDRVVGFGQSGYQCAFFTRPWGAASTEAPAPGPPVVLSAVHAGIPDLSTSWARVGCRQCRATVGNETESLPILWDCDLLLGPKGDNGEDTYVLCEINVSSVAPYPESAVPYVVDCRPGSGADGATERRFSARGQEF